METKLERLRRIEALEREHRRAMYGWNHPLNVEWAARRADEDRGGRDEDWKRWVEDQLAYLKDLLRDLEQQGRSSGGALPKPAKGASLPAAGEQNAEPNDSDRLAGKRSIPISINWRSNRHG